MLPDYLVDLANVCQTTSTFISFSAYLPQWLKLIRTKSSADISLRSWVLWLVSGSFALFYAIVQFQLNQRGWPLIISSSLSLTFIACTIGLIARFRGPRRGPVAEGRPQGGGPGP